jgi:hypothetical protein
MTCERRPCSAIARRNDRWCRRLAGDEDGQGGCNWTQPDAIAKQRPQSAARGFDTGLVEAIRVELGAMNRREVAADVGDGRDQRGEQARRIVFAGELPPQCPVH